MGWYLSNKYFATRKADAIHEQILRLYDVIRPAAVDLWNGFGWPEDLIGAPILGDRVEGMSWNNTAEAKAASGSSSSSSGTAAAASAFDV
eukprot:EC787734.1.p2 GENE.EC787734.1~~EC787734.1.p2  ORF type:complete len:90 (+),score=26.62 EC787734.1:111-380(+)